MPRRIWGAQHPGTRALLLSMVALPLLSGCASFKSSTRVDVGPFAENTVGMIGEVQRATKPVVWVQLKKYDQLPSVLSTRAAGLPARQLMRGVAMYSTQLVSLYESDLSETDRCRYLADYLDDAVRDRIRADSRGTMFISGAGLDSAISRVRASRSFLEALGAAQPVVSAALGYGNSVYDSIDARIDEAAAEIGSRVEAEFAPAKARLGELNQLHTHTLRDYTLLQQYRLGDDAALDSLRSRDPEAARAFLPGKAPSSSVIDAEEQRLLRRVETLNTLRMQVESQLSAYQAQQFELDELRSRALEGARLGRITLILWARSHRNLAAGVKVPAQINVMGLVRSAATSASNVVL